MNNLMHHHETYYTVEFWNNGDDYRTSMRFEDSQLANDVYEEGKHRSDNCEVKVWEVNYQVLYGKDGE